MADISKSQVRFLLDTSMLRANFCKTKLLYEALDLKKITKAKSFKFRDGSVTDEMTFYFSPTQNHPVSHTLPSVYNQQASSFIYSAGAFNTYSI